MPATLTTSNYVNRLPICTFSTGTSGEILLTISNLRTTGTPQPSYYGLYFTGLTTGPAARYDQINGAGGTYATTYVGTVAKESINSNNYVFYQVYKTSGVSLMGSPAQNNVQGTLTCSFTVDQPIVATGSLTISVPYQNYQYSSLGIAPVRSMVTTTPTVTGSYTSGSSKVTLSPTISTTQQTSQTLLVIMLQNSAVIPSGAVLTVVLSKLLMPPSLAPFSGINVNSGDADLYVIEEMDNLLLTNTLPGTELTTSYTSVAAITTLTGVLETSQTYSFKVYLTGDMPMNGFFTLSVPTIVGMPTAGVSGLTMKCQQYCDASTIVMSYANNLITFSNVVPTESDYIAAPGALQFQITGFTNPATTTSAYFIFTSYAVLDAGTFMIDQISNMHINAVQGVCTIKSFIPGDGNYQIYGVASMWNVTMYCEHAFKTTYGIQITLPSDWYVKDTTSCTVWGQSSNYACAGSSSAGTVTITSFFKTATTKNQVFTFQFNSVRNPTVIGQSYTIEFAVISTSGGVIDYGSYAFAKTLLTKGTVSMFTVIPENYGVGQYPTYYDFTFQPSGEIYKGAYIVLTLPDQVTVYNQIQFETSCSYNISGFTNTRINCKLNGNKVTISTGFTYEATSTMLTQNSMIPPIIQFTLPQIRNYRTMTTSDAFGLSVYSSSGTEIYTWNQTKALTINGVTVTNITYGPCVQMHTAATPQRVIITRGSSVNGAITDYNITVQTTNFLKEGDVIIITLPSPVFFSQTSRCLGASNNLRMNQTYTVAVGLNSMQITLLLPLSFRMLQAGSTRTIAAGESFTLTLTQVKNSYTTAPTDTSVIYSEYTGGNLIEQMSSGLILQNTLPGQFNTNKVSILPADFRQSLATNYTLTFQPVNYQQSMVIILSLPKQVTFSSNTVLCTGLQGTDSPSLKCSISANKTYINITDAVQFQKGNPGTIKIQFSTFVNPNTNLITDSFNLTTYSNQGWILDTLTTGLQVNFFCQYPCASCDQLIKTQCQSCYGGSQYPLWFQHECLSVCPASYTNSSNNCTACQSPCQTCSSATECITCIPGYNLIGTTCQQVIYWPFPYVFLSIVFFFIILCSEICTKKESKFKESLIALVSLPEIASWVTYLVFNYFRKGYTSGSFVFGAIALLCYIIINTLHAFIHPRAMIPKSPASYKSLAQNYRCNTFLVKAISYMFSFKFSLLLVSYLCMQPKYKGDYNEVNYKQFYRFGLAFIMIPYPLMIFSCSYYLYTDGLFSYTSFAAIEVIAISTLLACIMLLDSLSVIKFSKDTKTQNGIKVKAGAEDYESDQEGRKFAKKSKQRDNNAEFGRDEETSPAIRPISQYNSIGMSEDNLQQQMLLLEELAKQMRLEKQQLRQERERIDRERRAMSEQTQLREMQSYLNDDSYSRLHSRDGIHSINIDTVSKGDPNLAFLAEQDKLSTQQNKRQYFDVENEQIVDEIISEKDSEESIYIDKVQMPLPVSETVAFDYFGDVFYKEPALAYLSESLRSSIQNEMMYMPRDIQSAEFSEGTGRSLQSVDYLYGPISFQTKQDTIRIHDQSQPHPDHPPNNVENGGHRLISQSSKDYLELQRPVQDAQYDISSVTFKQDAEQLIYEGARSRDVGERDRRQLGSGFVVSSDQNVNAQDHQLLFCEVQRPIQDAVFENESDRMSKNASKQYNKREQSVLVRKGTYLDELHQQALQSESSKLSSNGSKLKVGANDDNLQSIHRSVSHESLDAYGLDNDMSFQHKHSDNKIMPKQTSTKHLKLQDDIGLHKDNSRGNFNISSVDKNSFDPQHHPQSAVYKYRQLDVEKPKKQQTCVDEKSNFELLESSEGFDQFKARIVKPDTKPHLREKSQDDHGDELAENHLDVNSENGSIDVQKQVTWSQTAKQTVRLVDEVDVSKEQIAAQHKDASKTIATDNQADSLQDAAIKPDDQLGGKQVQQDDRLEKNKQLTFKEGSKQVQQSNQDLDSDPSLNDNGPLDRIGQNNPLKGTDALKGAKTAKYGTKMLDYNKAERPESGKLFKKQKMDKHHQKPNGEDQSVQPIQSSNIVDSNPSNNASQTFAQKTIKRDLSFTRGSGTSKLNKSQTKQFQTLKDIVQAEIADEDHSVADQHVISEKEVLNELQQRRKEKQNEDASSYELSNDKVQSAKSKAQIQQSGESDSQEQEFQENLVKLKTGKYDQDNATNPIKSQKTKQVVQNASNLKEDGMSNHADSRPELLSENKPLDAKLARIAEQRQNSLNSSTSQDPFGLQVNEADEARTRMQKHEPQAEYMDKSGHSESSEGIVDHNPFTSAGYIQKANKEYAPKVVPTSRAKNIIYSDKSESSVEEMMGDTPSNYNVPNGRLDGKSAGLKAIVNLQQQQLTNQLQVPPKQSLAQMIGGKGMSESEERKFVLQMESSREGGWGNVNQPIGKRVQVIGEESGDEAPGPRKKKAIKTNKQFAENLGRNQKQSKTPAPMVRQQNQLQNEIRKNNFV